MSVIEREEREKGWARSSGIRARAGPQHTGRVNELQGWRSDQIGLRRWREKRLGKYTGRHLHLFILMAELILF